ncbi:MAG TPA: hypothetical protein VFM80_04215 [Gracilimonas sp.]|uniref:WD40/YVTN/BNR-like repeat-containing protein n=1 Tax=Gracilimonas sp. TaxID=1974203 RepID=UPI002DAB3CA6|nr:hypothetical protein [Gracilimonas sp.]
MKKHYLIFTFMLLPVLSQAQVIGPQDPSIDKFNTIRQNSVSTIAAFGDTVWISPALNRNIENAAEWYYPENAEEVVNGIGRVFSLSLAEDTVVTGLGFSAEGPGGSVPAGYGFYTSIDGGENWTFHDFPLDPDPPTTCDPGSSNYDPSCDITFQYGGETYTRIRTTVSEQSPPYAIDFNGDVILVSAWASGLLRSTDFGATWKRIILPPSDVINFSPDNTYEWNSQYDSQSINRYDPRGDNNLFGFGVLIDSQERVWFGSAGGINISENALTAPTDSVSWNRVRFDNSPDGLLGDWIIAIKEDPQTKRIWLTNWIAEQPQKQGVVYTDDGGETFTQVLIGERINDIGFKDGYVFAAGDNGLFISEDGGNSWIKSPQIKSPNTIIKSSAQYFAVASTTERVWVGTDDGIASTDDYGFSWEITRVDFPLTGGNRYEPDARNVNTYAYPNPFSPTIHKLVRIKFEVEAQGNVRVRVFDLGMNLVREIENNSFASGIYEAVWDGYDGKGRKVANAPYIYIIETESGQINGKILLAD